MHYLIARKPTASHYARPLALRDLLDQCTIAEYVFGEFFVARLEPVCSTAAPLPAEPVLTARPGTYDDLDPTILLRGDWERGDDSSSAFEHTVTYTDIPGAEIRFAFEGGELTYVFTKAANRGIAAVTIDGAVKGTIDLYSVDPQWQSSVRFRRSRRRPSPRRDSRHRRKPRRRHREIRRPRCVPRELSEEAKSPAVRRSAQMTIGRPTTRSTSLPHTPNRARPLGSVSDPQTS